MYCYNIIEAAGGWWWGVADKNLFLCSFLGMLGWVHIYDYVSQSIGFLGTRLYVLMVDCPSQQLYSQDCST